MDLFFDRNDISSQKRKKLFNDIEKFVEERMEYENTISEVNKNSNKVFLEEINMNANKHKAIIESNKILNEATTRYDKSVDDLFKSFLIETIIDGLNIDSDLIHENKLEISKKIKGVYDSLKEEFSYNNLLISDVKMKCEKSIAENLNAFRILDLLENDISSISLIVKEKVAKVLDEESKISDIEIKNEEGNYATSLLTTNTLFKEMYTENVKATIKELEEASDGIEYTKEEILESSYLETIVDYTILETLNTTRLIDFKDNFYEDSSRKTKTRRCGIDL